MNKKLQKIILNSILAIIFLSITIYSAYAREDFERIVSPTLVILGDRDGWVRVDEAVEMYHLIPNSELAILPNTDHTTDLAHWTPTVLDFLLRHSPIAG